MSWVFNSLKMSDTTANDSVNLLGQLADCEENDPARCELIIIEGDLAGECCKLVRDHCTQAILPFSSEKAITENIFAEKESINMVLSHSDIKTLVSALGTGGTGVGKDDFDIEKLRYHKIILLCDDHIELSLLRLLLMTYFYRELPQLLAKGYVYLAQPPLFQVLNTGQYIKDDREMNRYRIRRGAEELAVKVKKTGKKLKGRALSLLLEGMLEFYDYYRRLEGKLFDRKLVDSLLETMSGSKELMQRGGPQLHGIFADGSLLGTVVSALSEAGYKIELISDEESKLSEIEVKNVSGGRSVLIDKKLFSEVEFQRAVDLYQSTIQSSPPPFFVKEGNSVTEIRSRRDLLIYVLTIGAKNLLVQRFKYIGEMNPAQIWESTLDPEKRSLLPVTIGNVVNP